jgi:hypothetical protein
VLHFFVASPVGLPSAATAEGRLLFMVCFALPQHGRANTTCSSTAFLRTEVLYSMSKTNDALVKKCLSKLGEALKRFGTYSFDDKGPNEVMDIKELTDEIRRLPAVDAVAVLQAINSSGKYEGRGASLASTLIVNMQDWDELFEQDLGIDW